MNLENYNNDFLSLPENLNLNWYNPDWARYLSLRYQNSLDCSDEYSNVKIDLLNNQIIPIYPKIDDSTKKWFGSWEALLSNDNKETYSSSMLMIFSNNIAEKNNQTLDELDFLTIKKVEKSVEKDVLKMFDLKNSVNSKKSYGGTSPFNVNKMIKKYQKEFKWLEFY